VDYKTGATSAFKNAFIGLFYWEIIVNKVIISASLFSLILSGCVESEKSAAEKCLDSFRYDFKDPESGKVINFTENMLTYTATNSYGARIQGKAICKQLGENWQRDFYKEKMMALDRSTELLEKSIECKKAGGSNNECAGSSAALKRSDENIFNDLMKESLQELGFN
jgi:hypothetical protein